jgi:outer membrane immunogenic protein
MAADMPVPMPMKAAPYVAPFYNWTGLYVGFNGGYGFGYSDWSRAGLATGGFKINGPVAGGTIGYNLQMGAYVWGVEGDFDWANIKGTTNNGCAPGCTTKDTWLATARGRLGYAFDRWLPFITAGAGFGDVKAETPFGSTSKTKIGWTAGGGVEWAFINNWTAKVEYLYVDLGKGQCSGACAGPGGPIDVKFATSLVRAGLNYRF